MNQAQIKQHGRVLSVWSTQNKQVTQRVRDQADARAKVGRRENLLESGYYELVIVNKTGQELDSEDLIA